MGTSDAGQISFMQPEVFNQKESMVSRCSKTYKVGMVRDLLNFDLNS